MDEAKVTTTREFLAQYVSMPRWWYWMILTCLWFNFIAVMLNSFASPK